MAENESGSTPPVKQVETPYTQTLKEGDRDPFQGVLIKSILYATETFIVYLDSEIFVRWWSTWVEAPDFFATIRNRVGHLEARSEFLRRVHPKRDLITVRTLIGEGMIQLFLTKDQAKANAMLDIAEIFIKQRGAELSRLWYFLPFSILGISLTLLFVCLLANHLLAKMLPLACSIAGGIGAFISSAIGNTRIPCVPSAGRGMHYLEVIIRLGVGLGAGTLAYLLSKGDIAVGFLSSRENASSTTPYGLLAIALLAGASEQLLPSLITKFDDSVSHTNTTKSVENEGGNT